MKIKNIIAGLALMATMAVGVGVGLNANKNAQPANASSATVFSLAGTMNGWSATDTTYNMTDPDGDGIYTTNLSISSTNCELKVVENHSWDVSYGFDNLLIQHGSGSSWNNGGNIGLWNSTALTVTVCFRTSDNAIMVFPSGSVPTSWKTFYFIVNDQDGDDWTGDWSNPRIHYWGSNYKVVWNESGVHCPSLTNLSRKYWGGGKHGDLYSISVPSTITGVKALKTSTTDGATADLDVTDGSNAANFYYYNENCLYGFSLEVANDGAYLRGDWTDGWSISGQIPMTSSSSSGPYSVTGVNLSAGSAVKALYMSEGTETWCQFNSVESSDPDHYPVIEVDDHQGGYNAGVQSSGTYNITATYDSVSEKWDYYFVGTENADLEAALAFISGFTSAMEANCPATSESGSSAKVATAWSGQITAYTALDENAQYYLLDEDSRITAVTDFFSSYDWIYSHYATVRALSGADFLGRSPAVAPNLSINLFSGSISESSSTVVVVIVVSLVAVTAIGGYFFLRRKEQ